LNLKFFKTVTCRVTSLVTAMLAGCVSLKLYSHYIPVEVYGVIVVALQILSYLPYVDGGFRTTTNREILANETREGKLRMIRFAQTFYSHFTLWLLPLALLLMAGYSLTPNVTHAGQPRLFFLAVGLVAAISLLAWAQVELLVGLGEQANFFLIMALNSCGILGTLWLCLYFGLGIWAFPFSTLGGICAYYPVTLWLIRRKEPAVQFFCFHAGAEFWSELRRLWPNAWSCIRQQVSLLFLSMDVVLVGLICGSAKDAAIYAVTARLIGLIRSLLQATSEAAWPIVAQGKETDHAFAAFILRTNGWAIGSAVGAMALTLGPFLSLYMGAQWAPPRILVVLLTGRLMIVGLSSAASTLLMGAGDFKTIARYFLRELIVATVLGVLLGMKFGMIGVASGFLVATAFGEFFQMFYAYGRSVNASGGRFMWQAWWRGATGCAVSCSVAAILLPLAGNAWQIFAVGAGATLTAFAVGLTICVFRFPPTRAGGTFRSRVREVMANI
jgi:O-antigen/teichoic acid export membrane protein